MCYSFNTIEVRKVKQKSAVLLTEIYLLICQTLFNLKATLFFFHDCWKTALIKLRVYIYVNELWNGSSNPNIFGDWTKLWKFSKENLYNEAFISNKVSMNEKRISFAKVAVAVRQKNLYYFWASVKKLTSGRNDLYLFKLTAKFNPDYVIILLR